MPASWTIYGLRGIWFENDASQISIHPRVGEVSGLYPCAQNQRMSVEAAILIWLIVGAGIAAGVFVVARSAIQIGSVAYRVMEKQLSGGAATRQTILLSVVMVGGILVTALIAGYAIFAMFGQLLDTTGSLNTLNLNNGS
jgi:hypothetical protein